MKQSLDLDVTYTPDKYWWDVEVDQSQGHKVKGRGQICKFVKTLFQLYNMNQLLDIDTINTYDWYR